MTLVKERTDTKSVPASKTIDQIVRQASADPLLDLLERSQQGNTLASGIESDVESDAILDPLHEEQKFAPAATTMAGVLAGFRYGVEDIRDFDVCTDGILAAALAGLERLADLKPVARIAARSPDPVFVLISEHSRSVRDWDRLPEATDDNDPAWLAADERESAAWNALIETVPTTLNGIAAYVAHLNQKRFVERLDLGGDIPLMMKTLNAALGALVP